MFSTNLSFHNWSTADFVCKWANVEYTFKAGKTYSVPSDAGVHFAKHLAQLELNKCGQETFTVDPPSPNYKSFFDKALPSLSIQQPFEEVSFEEVTEDPNAPLKAVAEEKVVAKKAVKKAVAKKAKDDDYLVNG